MTELERCDAEIRQVELLLCGGHADVAGLLLALVDWSTERRSEPEPEPEPVDDLMAILTMPRPPRTPFETRPQ